MSRHSHFPDALVQRYDKSGPRYTSYPPATEFYDAIGETDYRDWARQSNEEPIPKPLSLYFHIPFCSSICYYCACNKVITKNRERAQPYLDDLYREIEIQSELFDSDRKVDQLHWGGGTPTYLTVSRSTNDPDGFLELNPMTAGLLDAIDNNDQKLSGESLLRNLARQTNYPDVEAFVTHGAVALQEMRQLEILTGARSPD